MFWLGMILIILLPLLGSLISNKGLPPGFGIFPPQKVAGEPGFNLYYFLFIALGETVIILLILFPALFGFKKLSTRRTNDKTECFRYPLWFWLGSIVCLGSWFVMWGGVSLGGLEIYTFVPLWWGFICALDGIVYKRSRGYSLLASRPKLVLLLSLTSIFGWYLFEYLNYFVNENWYYPNNKLLSPVGNVVWYTLAYTTVWPAIFEWYLLLQTFEGLKNRYTNGPKLNLTKKWGFIIMLGGALLTFGTGIFSHLLFFGLWIGPLFILSGLLIYKGYWTPYSPMAKGNWSPFILMGLASLFNGFLWEMWNYGSHYFNPDRPTNPNFWIYDIPYVNVIRIFSEMPLLGYFGYLPFGVLCWVFWLWAAYLFNLEPDFASKLNKQEGLKNEIDRAIRL